MLLTFVIIYMAVTFAVGMLSGRLVKNSGDFVMAGRKLPLFFNAADLFALWFGSETIFGASSAFSEDGLRGVIEDPFGASLCLILIGWIYIRRLYRMNLFTLGDLFRVKFGKQAELVSGIFMLFTFFGYIAAQFIALGLILTKVAAVSGVFIGSTEAIWICAAIVILYTMTGGMWAVSITDFIQSILIVTGLIAAVIFLLEITGGFHVVMASAPADTFTFFPEKDTGSILQWIGAWLVIGLGYIPSQDVFQRANAARNERAAVRSMYIGAGLYFVIAMIPLFITLCARVIAPDADFSDGQAIVINTILEHTPSWVQILFCGALLSAVLSTCSGSILAPASILAVNIIKPVSRRVYSDRQMTILLRLSVVLIAGVSLGISMMRNNIYELVGESAIIGMVSLLVPLTAGLYMQRPSPRGALFSMWFGIIVYVLFTYVWTLEVIPTFIPATLASVFGLYLGKATEQEDVARADDLSA
ncbi:MAG: sodium:solute symporter family protein [Chitinophagales bacterium]